MGSGVLAQNLRQAVSRDQGKFGKQRLASCLRFGGKRIDLLQAVGVSYRPSRLSAMSALGKSDDQQLSHFN